MATHATTKDQTIEYDPFSATTVEDPYPIYAVLRNSQPLYHNAQLEFYALTRYDDIVEYGRDWETFSYEPTADIDDTGEAFGPGNFMDLDPPAHTAMRDVVRKEFNPRGLKDRLGRVIERESNQLIDTLIEQGGGDFGWDIAWTLPMRVISDFLGFPREDLGQLAAWEADFSRRTLGQRAVPQFAADASHNIQSYFSELINDRRIHPRSDLLTVIARAHVNGEPLGDEAASMAFLFWGASVETTACLLTNGAVLLDDHPDQRAWLADTPEAIPDAIEEMLRYEAPLQVTRRTTTREVELYGASVPQGSSVFTVFGAANRDERRFEDPETFDIRREPKRHLAFGNGIHHCLGAPLARLEAQILYRVLLEKCPEYTVQHDELHRLEHYIDRGFTRVPISLD